MLDMKQRNASRVHAGNHAWRAGSLFPPCTVSHSLLEAVTEAVKNAAAGEVILLSPACSKVDQFQNHQQSAEEFCRSVKSISRGGRGANPHMNGDRFDNLMNGRVSQRNMNLFALRFFEGKPRSEHPITYLTERTLQRQIQ
jgi:hypothetical protein